MGTGYRVAPAQLLSAAQELRQLRADILDELSEQLEAESVPATAWGQIKESPEAAEQYKSLLESVKATDDQARTRVATIAQGLDDSAHGYTAADEQIAQGYQQLDQRLSAPPGVASATRAGNGPWSQAIIDNRAKIASALSTQEHRLDQLQQSGGSADDIKDAQARIALYKSLLDDSRQVVVFDDSGNGRIAELFGQVGSDTRNVGVLVPGTHAGMASHDYYAGVAQSWVNQDPNHGLAMVVYTDGRNPQNLLTQSPFPQYAQAVGPDLAAFTASTRAEMLANAPGAALTVAGHSYGSADVGAARLDPSFTADRVMSVEGAGVGPGIYSVSDLPPAQQSVPMYSMTAPNDPIALIQNDSPLYPAAHALSPLFPPLGALPDRSPLGADPDTFGSTVDLDPGRVDVGSGVLGYNSAAHMAVLTPNSDAWWNMYHVFQDQPPTVLHR